RRFYRTAPGAGPPVAGRLARAGRHPPGRAGPRRRRPARALPGDHGLLRQRSTGRLDRPPVDPWWGGGRGPRGLPPATTPRRRGPRPRGRYSRSLRSAPGVGAQRPAERGVLEAGLHATLARTAPGDHRTDTGGARRSRPVLPGG